MWHEITENICNVCNYQRTGNVDIFLEIIMFEDYLTQIFSENICHCSGWDLFVVQGTTHRNSMQHIKALNLTVFQINAIVYEIVEGGRRLKSDGLVSLALVEKSFNQFKRLDRHKLLCI